MRPTEYAAFLEVLRLMRQQIGAGSREGEESAGA